MNNEESDKIDNKMAYWESKKGRKIMTYAQVILLILVFVYAVWVVFL